MEQNTFTTRSNLIPSHVHVFTILLNTNELSIMEILCFVILSLKKETTLFFFCRNVGLGFLTNKNNFQLLVLGLKNTLILTQKVQLGEFTGYFSPNSQSGTQGVDSVFELVFHSLYLPHTGAHMFVCTRVHVV